MIDAKNALELAWLAPLRNSADVFCNRGEALKVYIRRQNEALARVKGSPASDMERAKAIMERAKAVPPPALSDTARWELDERLRGLNHNICLAAGLGMWAATYAALWDRSSDGLSEREQFAVIGHIARCLLFLGYAYCNEWNPFCDTVRIYVAWGSRTGENGNA